MKRQTLFHLITVLYFSINGYSQVCGGGILTLNIYVINGNKVNDISYEIFPVSKELIEKYNYHDEWDSGKIIYNFSEKDILPNEELTNKLTKLLEGSSISKSGKLTASLKFKTRELEYFPIILKISKESKTIYILGNYFGGCNREACLLWNGNYFRLL